MGFLPGVPSRKNLGFFVPRPGAPNTQNEDEPKFKAGTYMDPPVPTAQRVFLNNRHTGGAYPANSEAGRRRTARHLEGRVDRGIKYNIPEAPDMQIPQKAPVPNGPPTVGDVGRPQMAVQPAAKARFTPPAQQYREGFAYGATPPPAQTGPKFSPYGNNLQDTAASFAAEQERARFTPPAWNLNQVSVQNEGGKPQVDVIYPRDILNMGPDLTGDPGRWDQDTTGRRGGAGQVPVGQYDRSPQAAGTRMQNRLRRQQEEAALTLQNLGDKADPPPAMTDRSIEAATIRNQNRQREEAKRILQGATDGAAAAPPGRDVMAAEREFDEVAQGALQNPLPGPPAQNPIQIQTMADIAAGRQSPLMTPEQQAQARAPWNQERGYLEGQAGGQGPYTNRVQEGMRALGMERFETSGWAPPGQRTGIEDPWVTPDNRGGQRLSGKPTVEGDTYNLSNLYGRGVDMNLSYEKNADGTVTPSFTGSDRPDNPLSYDNQRDARKDPAALANWNAAAASLNIDPRTNSMADRARIGAVAAPLTAQGQKDTAAIARTGLERVGALLTEEQKQQAANIARLSKLTTSGDGALSAEELEDTVARRNRSNQVAGEIALRPDEDTPASRQLGGEMATALVEKMRSESTVGGLGLFGLSDASKVGSIAEGMEASKDSLTYLAKALNIRPTGEPDTYSFGDGDLVPQETFKLSAMGMAAGEAALLQRAIRRANPTE